MKLANNLYFYPERGEALEDRDAVALLEDEAQVADAESHAVRDLFHADTFPVMSDDKIVHLIQYAIRAGRGLAVAGYALSRVAFQLRDRAGTEGGEIPPRGGDAPRGQKVPVGKQPSQFIHQEGLGAWWSERI